MLDEVEDNLEIETEPKISSEDEISKKPIKVHESHIFRTGLHATVVQSGN
jgi:hypothetical protein